MQKIAVSVIIPFTRRELIETVLLRLQQQTYPTELLEVVVVGQQSSALAERWSITAIETPGQVYPGVGRNLGARMARGTYLLFLDDDCEPAPDWVEQNLYELQLPGVGAVGGQIAGKSRSFFAQCVDFSSFAFCQRTQRSEIQICSASMGIKREVYAAVQGFDETLRLCEDIDFCYRLQKLGYTTVYQPAIKIVHNHRRNSFRILIQYNHFFGRESGLYVKLLHPGMTRRNQLLARLRHPLLYALMIIPVSLGITAIIVGTNIQEYPRVLGYAPFIFLAKVAYHVGVLQWIVQGPKK